MRQIMPHRNNIAMHRTKCKMFFNRGGQKAPATGADAASVDSAQHRFSLSLI